MTDYMPRKKKINPGRNCRLCVLYGQTRYQYYVHPIHWSNRLRENFLALEDIDVNNCICRNCEKDIKNDINNPSNLPCWKKENVSIKKICIVPTCSCASNITINMIGFMTDNFIC